MAETENNVFEESEGPLAADAVYTSEWMDMRQFQAVSGMISGDEILNEARFEWSNDRATIRLRQVWFSDGNPLSYGGVVSAAVPTQAKYVRLVVENGSNAQGAPWKAVLALLQGTSTGLIAPLVAFPGDSDPGQTVKAVLFGRRIGSVTPQYTHVLVDGGGQLITTDGPLPSTNFGQRIPATLDSTLVTSFNPEQRSSLSIFNSATAGNLYVRLGADVDLGANEWDWKVPPNWFWNCPAWGGDVYIAWDSDADGFGHCQEVTG